MVVNENKKFEVYTDSDRKSLLSRLRQEAVSNMYSKKGHVALYVKTTSVEIITAYQGVFTRRSMSFPKEIVHQAVESIGPVAEQVLGWASHALTTCAAACDNMQQRCRIEERETEFVVNRPHSSSYGSFSLPIPPEVKDNSTWREAVWEELICYSGTLNATLGRGRFTLDMLKGVHTTEGFIRKRIEKLTQLLTQKEDAQ